MSPLSNQTNAATKQTKPEAIPRDTDCGVTRPAPGRGTPEQSLVPPRDLPRWLSVNQIRQMQRGRRETVKLAVDIGELPFEQRGRIRYARLFDVIRGEERRLQPGAEPFAECGHHPVARIAANELPPATRVERGASPRTPRHGLRGDSVREPWRCSWADPYCRGLAQPSKCSHRLISPRMPELAFNFCIQITFYGDLRPFWRYSHY